jgi:hypothetical protein
MAERYINAYDLAETIENLDITVAGKPARWNDAKYTVLKEIAEAPDADVVEVVRCKDCIHAQNMPLGLCYLHTEPYDNAKGYKGDAVCVEPDDFCSYGQKKGE